MLSDLALFDQLSHEQIITNHSFILFLHFFVNFSFLSTTLFEYQVEAIAMNVCNYTKG